jgi:hypothetical protein
MLPGKRGIEFSPIKFSKKERGSGPFPKSQEKPDGIPGLMEVPMPKLEFEKYINLQKNRLMESRESQDVKSPQALDLLANYEAYHDSNLDIEKALLNIKSFVAKLEKEQEEKGKLAMIKLLTKRLYDNPYSYSQNTALGLFSEKGRGNCQATAKAATAILETSGFDPRTEIAHQMFRDHVRAVARVDGRWYVLEGKARPLKDKEMEGTVFVSLEGEKYGILGLDVPEDLVNIEVVGVKTKRIELGTKVFHETDGSVANKGLLKWFKDGIKRIDEVLGKKMKKEVVPSIHQIYASKYFATFPRLESFVASLISLTPKSAKYIASGIAAFSFTYAVEGLSRPEIKTLADLSEQIHKDVDDVEAISTAVVREIADTLKDLKSSVLLENSNEQSEYGDDDIATRIDEKTVKITAPATINQVDPQTLSAVEQKFDSYFGLAHMAFAPESASDTQWDMVFMNGKYTPVTTITWQVHDEAQTLGRDLYCFLVYPRETDAGVTVHNFVGKGLSLNMREEQKIMSVVNPGGYFNKIHGDRISPLMTLHRTDIKINGRMLLSLGGRPKRCVNPEGLHKRLGMTCEQDEERESIDAPNIISRVPDHIGIRGAEIYYSYTFDYAKEEKLKFSPEFWYLLFSKIAEGCEEYDLKKRAIFYKFLGRFEVQKKDVLAAFEKVNKEHRKILFKDICITFLFKQMDESGKERSFKLELLDGDFMVFDEERETSYADVINNYGE